MENKEVWISSTIHQKELSEVYENNSSIRKMLGIYKLPTNFPSMKIMWQNLPVVYQSKSLLDILEDRLVFYPIDNIQTNSYQNIDFNFRKIVLFKNITRIKTYTNQKPFMKSFNVEWIDLSYVIDSKEDSLLLCVGGKFMKTIREETKNLFHFIEGEVENITKQEL